MRAVVARAGVLRVDEIDAPVPRAGQVLARPVASGICGSDLHALDMQAEDPEQLPPLVFGHEFCAEIVEHGPDTDRRLPSGTLVCSVPFIDGDEGPELLGFTPNYPGGFAELMVLQEHRLLAVPNGLSAEHAAITEPLAVGIHAVAAARMGRNDVPLVIGCGPVGLAVIAALRIAGHRPVIASDYSAARRARAEQAGADVVVDPATDDAYATWLGRTGDPLPPSPLLAAGMAEPSTVVFDCVGAPGLMAAHIDAVPGHTRIIVVGVCTVEDGFVPVRAVEKELTVQYVFAYRPEEFAHALHLIANGQVDVASWITDACSLDRVTDAFSDLRNPDRHCKIIVTPSGAA